MTTITNPEEDHLLLQIATVARLLGVAEAAVARMGEQGELSLMHTHDGQYITVDSVHGYIRRKNRKAKKVAPKARANNEGSVYEAPKGSGIWYAAITIREGGKRRRIKRRARSQKEALRILEEMKRQYHDSIEVDPTPVPQPDRPTITYRALFAEWMHAIRISLKSSTQRHYQTAIDSRLNPYIGDKIVTADDYPMLQELFNAQLTALYAPYTIHTTYSSLALALEFAVDPRGYIHKNPAAKIKLPKAKAASPSIALQLDELLSVLRIALKQRYGPIILFATLTGARLSECLGVQERDLDRVGGTIHIQRQLSAIKGKGLVVETPKTDSSVRLIPRTPRLAEFLERYVAERHMVLRHLGYMEAEGGWLFLNSKGGLLHPRLAEEASDEIIERAGLSAKYPAVTRPGDSIHADGKASSYQPKTCAVSFHDLRHTFLTHLGDLGVDETTRGRIAGHGPKNVTQRYDRGTLLRMRTGMVAFEEIIFDSLDRENRERGKA